MCTHTKLRNRLGWAKSTHIAQLRQELHRDRPQRKRARVVTADDSSSSAAAEKSSPAQDSLMHVETLTSATEFRLTVNAYHMSGLLLLMQRRRRLQNSNWQHTWTAQQQSKPL